MDIEILGHIATLVSVGAMAFKNMVKLRTLSIIGSVMWIVYALSTGASSVAISSALFIVVHIIGLHNEVKQTKKDVK